MDWETKIRNILEELLVIKEQIRVEKKSKHKHSNHTSEEIHNTKNENHEHVWSRSHKQNDEADYESNSITNTNQDAAIPSAEISITVPRDKGPKQYRTYLGLVDTGTSSSLINKDIVEFSSFTMKISLRSILSGSPKLEPFRLKEYQS